MKTKILLAATLLLIASTSVIAQNGRLSVGAELALPSGDYGDNAGTGFGGSLRYENPLGDNLGLMGTVGYLMYGTKTIESGAAGYSVKTEYTNSMIPIMVGGKYYFTEQQEGFYGMLQLGLTMLSSKFETTSNIPGVPSTSDTQSNSAFTWSPGIGYCLGNLDFGFGYYAFSYTQDVTVTIGNISSTSSVSASGSWMGLRVAYMFGEK
jgi:hypothetical protein